MRTEELSIILTADFTAKLRGRAFPSADEEKYLRSGCGWVPANLAIDAAGMIAPNGFGSVGDLRMMPDAATRAELDLGDGQKTVMFLANLHTPDGAAWQCDPRTFLQRAVVDLQEQAGLYVVSSFEHEFMLLGEDQRPVNLPFALEAYLDHSQLGRRTMAALQDAGLKPEMWLPEFGRNQFEVTLAPTDALTAGDRALYLREICRHVASGLGRQITFSPILTPGGGGNGVHIHLSLTNLQGQPVAYDAAKPGKLSDTAAAFAAGILKYAAGFQAVAAASPLSYERLQPERWSAGGVYLGEENREALLRICPLFHTPGADHAKQYNLEYRAADATANPYLILGCLIRAGLRGIQEKLPRPRVISGDISQLSLAEQREMGVAPIQGSLEEALVDFETSVVGREWFAPELAQTFVAVKRAELARFRELDPAERYRLYATTY